MGTDINDAYELVQKKLSKQFESDLDLQAILFLIGVQELGKGNKQFSKSEKLDLMHIAICTLLSQFNYYTFDGLDDDGWPHWTPSKDLPKLKPEEQQQLIKKSIVSYFNKDEQSKERN